MKNQVDVPSEVTKTRAARFMTFLGYYVAGATILTIIFAILMSEPIVIVAIFVPTLVYLPWGAVFAIQWAMQNISFDIALVRMIDGGLISESLAGSIFIGLSYLSLIATSVAGSLTKKLKTFRALRLAFIILLIINIGGCTIAGS